MDHARVALARLVLAAVGEAEVGEQLVGGHGGGRPEDLPTVVDHLVDSLEAGLGLRALTGQELHSEEQQRAAAAVGSAALAVVARSRDRLRTLMAARINLSLPVALTAPGDLYDPDHQAILAAIVALDAEGQPVDVVTLADALRRRGELERVGGAGALADILAAVPSAANGEAYAVRVGALAARRAIIRAASEAAGRAFALADDPGEIAADLGAELAGVQRRLAGGARFDLAAETEAVVAELDPERATKRRWPTGLEAVDALVGGFESGATFVVGARSRHCKTALSVGFTLATLSAGGSVLQIRYEEAPAAILRRLASLATGIPYAAAQVHTLREGERAIFADTLRGMARAFADRLWIHCGCSLPEIEGLVTTLRPWLLILDTAQKAALTLPGDSNGRHDLKMGALTGWLAGLALRHDLCVVVNSQISRRSAGRMPTMGDLRESAAIEEDADVALLGWWPWLDGHKDMRERYVLDVGKNRLGGRLDRLVLAIDPQTQRFDSVLLFEAERVLRQLGGQ